MFKSWAGLAGLAGLAGRAELAGLPGLAGQGPCLPCLPCLTRARSHEDDLHTHIDGHVTSNGVHATPRMGCTRTLMVE